MKKRIFSNKAFTLIEILVVVLIIGILAAIAIPQYRKAVMKAQAVEAVVNLKAIKRDQQDFFIANNTYTTDLADLDIQLNDKFYKYRCIKTTSIDCYASRTDGKYPSFELVNSTLYCRGTKKDCDAFSVKPDQHGSTIYWLIEDMEL